MVYGGLFVLFKYGASFMDCCVFISIPVCGCHFLLLKQLLCTSTRAKIPYLWFYLKLRSTRNWAIGLISYVRTIPFVLWCDTHTAYVHTCEYLWFYLKLRSTQNWAIGLISYVRKYARTDTTTVLWCVILLKIKEHARLSNQIQLPFFDAWFYLKLRSTGDWAICLISYVPYPRYLSYVPVHVLLYR